MTVFEICMFLLLAPVMLYVLSLGRKIEDCLDAIFAILTDKRKDGEG